jgi:hypothetical protein
MLLVSPLKICPPYRLLFGINNLAVAQIMLFGHGNAVRQPNVQPDVQPDVQPHY